MSPRKTLTNDHRRKALPIKHVLYGVFGMALILQVAMVRRWRTAKGVAVGQRSKGEEKNNNTAIASMPQFGRNAKNRHENGTMRHLGDPHYPLPQWILDYFAWHRSMRAAYPGSTIFTDPNAPPILIRTCLGLCGGLHDRLGQLPWDVYLANQTRRVLFLSWHRPVPLENFLLPNIDIIDWSVPRDVKGFFPTTGSSSSGGDEKEVRVSREGMKVIRAYTELFEGLGDETHPDATFRQQHVDTAITRAVERKFKNVKVLRHRILGHVLEEDLERRLQRAGETDMLHSTPSFGSLFRSFFRLAPPVQKVLNSVYKELNLQPGQYSGVHCRVRHPKAVVRNVPLKAKVGEYTADKTGLLWEGETRNGAIQVATRAIQCATVYFQVAGTKEPIYFFSDSNDLVRYMAKELTSAAIVQENKLIFANSPLDAAALSAVQNTTILARDMSLENAHIDLQKGRDPPAYFMTFVDLFLAINARCLAFGVGYYAVFAAKISGTQCTLLYEKERWGEDLSSSKHRTTLCALPEDESSSLG